MTDSTTFEQFAAAYPEVVAGLRAVTKAVDDGGVPKALTELMKVRASQLNGCAFCLSLHLGWARVAGVSDTKLDLVAAWRDAGVFSAQEMAALEWTETVTHALPAEHMREEMSNYFSDKQVALLTVAIATINAWNRIAAPLGFPPPAK